MIPLDEIKHNRQYRTQVFQKVFNNPDGACVLGYLKSLLDVHLPDMKNPYDVYYRLGRYYTVKLIENIVHKPLKGDKTND